MIDSPCTNECATDGNKCISCGRTIDEIINWTELSDEQKQAVLDRINK